MPPSIKNATHFFVLALLALILVELFFRLSSFPGLHGDEAWVGLRAIDIGKTGFTSVHGMNTYTGALFPQIVATIFAALGKSAFSLRLAGATFNWMALVVLAATFWRLGRTAFFSTLLFASSLFFLFYSRVAWEVCALQNLMLALIVAALAKLLPAPRAGIGWVLLFIVAFTFGAWNHFIFMAASLSFVLASLFVVLTTPGTESARLFLIGAFNLPLQVVLWLGEPQVPDGPFSTHAMPALLAGLLLAVATSVAYIRSESFLLPQVVAFPQRMPKLARGLRMVLVLCTMVGLMWTVPYDGVSFFGTVSGYIVLERVVSYVPSALEAAAFQTPMAVLSAAFAVLAFQLIYSGNAERRNILKCHMLLWTIAFFLILRITTLQIPERYFIIPQFLFFVTLALSMDELPSRWRQVLQAAIAVAFLSNQYLFWREVTLAENRLPDVFHYGFYEDNSRNFLKLDALHTYLREHQVCGIQSKSWFIDKSMHFLLASDAACGGTKAVHIEYCDTCLSPVARFAISPIAGRR